MSQNFHHYLVLHVGSKYTRSQSRYIIIIIIIIIKIITVILNATNIVFIILDLVMVLGNFLIFLIFFRHGKLQLRDRVGPLVGLTRISYTTLS